MNLQGGNAGRARAEDITKQAVTFAVVIDIGMVAEDGLAVFFIRKTGFAMHCVEHDGYALAAHRFPGIGLCAESFLLLRPPTRGGQRGDLAAILGIKVGVFVPGGLIVEELNENTADGVDGVVPVQPLSH